MKRLISLLFICFIFSAANSQRNADFGIMAGGSSYFGEINPVKPFYKPSPAFGGFFRFNINKRYAVRFNVAYMPITGSTSDFPERVYNFTEMTDFSTGILDVALQAEFNFLPYITGEAKSISSTYIAGGLGMASNDGLTATIPFGLGVKVNLGERLSSGAELSFRKTFTDELDQIENPLGNTLLNNNDWYYFFGLFISYKFVKFAADCPVYK